MRLGPGLAPKQQSRFFVPGRNHFRSNERRLKQSAGRVSLGSVLTKCSPWASPPQLRPRAWTSKDHPVLGKARPPRPFSFAAQPLLTDRGDIRAMVPFEFPMTLPYPTGDSVCFSALRSSDEKKNGAANPHRASSRAKGLRRHEGAYFRRSCSRNSNQIVADGFAGSNSDMPSHAVWSPLRCYFWWPASPRSPSIGARAVPAAKPGASNPPSLIP